MQLHYDSTVQWDLPDSGRRKQVNGIETSEELSAILARTREELLDLTRRNRLLNFKVSTRDVELIDCNADDVFRRLDSEGPSLDFGFIRQNPSTDQDISSESEIAGALQTSYEERELERKLDRLYREYRSQLEETGANNLYLAIGFLTFAESVDSQVLQRAPLLLVPVKMNRDRGKKIRSYSVQRHDDELDTNHSLGHKLRELSSDLPSLQEAMPSADDEEAVLRPSRYLELVSTAIRQAPDARWTVDNQITLGLFRFQKQVMWRDLDPERWPAHAPITDKEMVRRVLLGPQEGEDRPGMRESVVEQDQPESPVLRLVRDADSSQYSALVDTLATEPGRGLVIEGPPGTGKSQTISNLIAAAMDAGKSVLFLAEKMAALDVVYKRLEEVGLGDFCLQLHGLNTNKAELAQNLKHRINLSATPKRSGEDPRLRWQRSRDELKETSKALLHLVGPLYRPAHEVIWQVEALRQRLPEAYPLDSLSVPYDVNSDDFATASQLLADMGMQWEAIPKAARRVWTGFTPKETSEGVVRNIHKSLSQTSDKLVQLDSEVDDCGLAQAFYSKPTIATWISLAKKSPEAVLPSTPADLDTDLLSRLLDFSDIGAAKALSEKMHTHLNQVAVLNEIYDYQAPNSDEYATLIRSHLERIVGVSDIPNATIGDLDQLANEHHEVCDSLTHLRASAEPLEDLLPHQPTRVFEYGPLLDKASDLINGPEALTLYAEGIHARATAPRALEFARSEHDQIVAQIQDLSEFASERVNDTKALVDAANSLRAAADQWFPILRREYRTARRLTRSLLRDRGQFSRTPGFAERLNALVSACVRRDHFANTENHRKAFGAIFQGVDTDWTTLRSIIDTGARLRDLLGSEKAQSAMSNWDAHYERTSTAIELTRNHLQNIERFQERFSYPEALWNRPVQEICQTLRPHESKLDQASRALSIDAIFGAAALKEALEAAGAGHSLARRLEAEIESHAAHRTLFPDGWSAQTTQTKHIQSTIGWIEQCVEEPGISNGVLRWLCPGDAGLDAGRSRTIHQFATSGRRELSQVNRALTESGPVDSSKWFEPNHASFSDIAAKFEKAARHTDSLALLGVWYRVADRACEKQLKALVDEVLAGRLVGEQASWAYRACVLNSCLTAHIQKHSVLHDFTRDSYEALRERFRASDREVYALTASEIAESLRVRQSPQGISTGRVGSLTEMGLIDHQIGLKRNHRPIRYLMSKASNALQTLKPCFLMSPMSVAQFLPRGESNFDLLVMDEASQVRPEDALGAIARSTTCVIVGDPKQLPPTAFFEGTRESADGEEEFVTENVESILDICLKQLPFRRLTWHYRSEHESLIQFSNDRFYEGDLRVIPSPRRSARDLGVHATFVENPSYRRGGYNRGEAEIVVGKIIETLERFPKATIGAVAMNRRQAEEIEALLERAKREQPQLEEVILDLDEPLFIKNLENVQGDERDVIVISTTYGPEIAGGATAQRFGPINSDVGWRRLNVIVTRARQRVELVTSLRPSDVLTSETTKRGPKEFRAYLEYAQLGRILDPGTSSRRQPDSDFERSVITQIERMGFQCEPQIGVAGFFIDIGIVHPEHPGEFVLGIECDGASYHSAPSVRDRDRLRQEILESKGWSIHRIWSTSWFHARSIELTRLKARIEEAIEGARGQDRALIDWAPAELPEPFSGNLEDRIHEEEAESQDELADQLEQFWAANIKDQFSNREQSLLSPEMVKLLVDKRPYELEEFQRMIPSIIRERIDRREMVFLDDVLDIISGLA